MKSMQTYENVVVSTRMRLARNFADYPFPNKLKDEETAHEMVRILYGELKKVESFVLYEMNAVTEEKAEFLKERNLISQDLWNNRKYSAALVSGDESISVMINEEDHIREQYFIHGYDLRRAYERISGIDDIISEIIPFAYDEALGYLTACPTNIGTGLRASVMLFLPALVRYDKMRSVAAELKKIGLTVRGAFGEGSGSEGYMYQISNEVTLGMSELKILEKVENAVAVVAAKEFLYREQLEKELGLDLVDSILRAYGVLSSCMKLSGQEFMKLMTEVKLGVALGILEGDMGLLDSLIVDLRPANINKLNGAALSLEECDIYRAEYVGKALRGMELLTEKRRNDLSPRR